MSPLHLLWIVPGIFLFGWCLCAMFERMDNYDRRRLRLIEKQYRELRIEVEEYQPSPKTWLEMIAMHLRERAELDK